MFIMTVRVLYFYFVSIIYLLDILIADWRTWSKATQRIRECPKIERFRLVFQNYFENRQLLKYDQNAFEINRYINKRRFYSPNASKRNELKNWGRQEDAASVNSPRITEKNQKQWAILRFLELKLFASETALSRTYFIASFIRTFFFPRIKTLRLTRKRQHTFLLAIRMGNTVYLKVTATSSKTWKMFAFWNMHRPDASSSKILIFFSFLSCVCVA